MEEIFRIDRVLKENGIEIQLGINVSSKQFNNGNFVPHVKDIMEANRSQKINLVIEITESFLLNNFEQALQDIQALKELGVRIALDDFGTGFSSLSYLARLPIDFLKIDKSFIDGINDLQNINLTSSIISMARNIRLKTVAEGVETLEQVECLVREGCNELQGYYFSKPVEIDRFIAFVKKTHIQV